MVRYCENIVYGHNSMSCKYLSTSEFKGSNENFNQIMGVLIIMMNQFEKWTSFQSVE